MLSSRRAVLLWAGVLLVPGGCPAGGEDTGLSAAVSVPPQVFLVRRVAGPDVEIFSMLRPGESCETFQPSDHEISRMRRAAVYFRIGLPFERGAWFESLEEAPGDTRIVDMGEGVDRRHMNCGCGHDAGSHAHSGAGSDPHIWLAPGPLEVQAKTVARVLAEADPPGADRYRENLADVLEELEELDAELRNVLAPVKGRRIYVFHPAWGYLCDAYGLEQVAIEAEGKEPSDAEMTSVIERARADGVEAIFVSPQTENRSVEAVARSIGARVEHLDPLAPDLFENLRESAHKMAKAYER